MLSQRSQLHRQLLKNLNNIKNQDVNFILSIDKHIYVLVSSTWRWQLIIEILSSTHRGGNRCVCVWRSVCWSVWSSEGERLRIGGSWVFWIESENRVVTMRGGCAGDRGGGKWEGIFFWSHEFNGWMTTTSWKRGAFRGRRRQKFWA